MREDNGMWSPQQITVREMSVWIKRNNVKHRLLAEAIGISIHTLQNYLYHADRETLIPKWMCCAIASCVAFSGVPGLFGIRLIDAGVALQLSRGLIAAQLPKGKRSIADAKAIGYANQISQRLLRVMVINGECQVRADTASSQENPNAPAIGAASI